MGPMVEHIVSCTNIYIDKIKSNFAKERVAAYTNAQEVKDLFGCLFMIGYLYICRTHI